MLKQACTRLLPVAAAGALAPQAVSLCDGKAIGRGGQVFPGLGADGYKHDDASGFSLFLQERCKRIYFVRHAEGIHNLAERESTYEPPNLIFQTENSGYVYLDPKLTKRGEEQCANLKASIRGTSVWGFDKPLNLDLVVVSPTTRTLQTAQLSLGSPGSPAAPPFVANELCREHISEAMCDSRRSVSELAREFPDVDFSLMEDNEDTMFLKKETTEDVEERGRKFLMWLCGRPEQRIAVVTHSIFLKELLSQFADNVADEDRQEIHQSWVNAEMRSIMLCGHRKFASTRSKLEEKAQPLTASQSSRTTRVHWNTESSRSSKSKTF
jgi:broad specificity phosphatase PhoE